MGQMSEPLYGRLWGSTAFFCCLFWVEDDEEGLDLGGFIDFEDGGAGVDGVGATEDVEDAVTLGADGADGGGGAAAAQSRGVVWRGRTRLDVEVRPARGATRRAPSAREIRSIRGFIVTAPYELRWKRPCGVVSLSD